MQKPINKPIQQGKKPLKTDKNNKPGGVYYSLSLTLDLMATVYMSTDRGAKAGALMGGFVSPELAQSGDAIGAVVGGLAGAIAWVVKLKQKQKQKGK